MKAPATIVEGVTLYQADVAQAIAKGEGSTLVIADPPWTYTNTGGTTGGRFRGAAKASYDTGELADICATLTLAYHAAAPDAYLVMWWTFPLLADIWPAVLQTPWSYKTGGTWGKAGRMGTGFHARSCCEPWALLTKGKPKPRHRSFRNYGWASAGLHSEKPEAELVRMLEALSSPGELVLSLYSGMFPEGRAALRTGRRCVGAELDPERWAAASARLAPPRPRGPHAR